MLKENQLIKAVNNNDLSTVKNLLKDKKIHPQKDNNDALYIASQNGYLDIVKLLLKDKRVDPSNHSNQHFRVAAIFGHFNVALILLNDKRVNPTDCNNQAISQTALKYGDPNYKPIQKSYPRLTKLLWKDKRVKNSLKYDDSDLYEKLLLNDVKNKINNF